MSIATTYRTCPRSGLQFEANAEKLIIANAVAAVVFLLAKWALLRLYAWLLLKYVLQQLAAPT